MPRCIKAMIEEAPRIILLSYTECESRYLCDGVVLRLWAIVGGTLAVDFEDFGYSQRYNYSEKFDSNKSQWETWSGPRIADLDGGAETLRKFIKEQLPKKELQEKRVKILKDTFGWKITSRRFHDTDNRAYVVFHIDLNHFRCPTITADSASYGGRASENCIKFADEKWNKVYSVLQNAPYSLKCWHELTEEEFNQVVDTMKILK